MVGLYNEICKAFDRNMNDAAMLVFAGDMGRLFQAMAARRDQTTSARERSAWNNVLLRMNALREETMRLLVEDLNEDDHVSYVSTLGDADIEVGGSSTNLDNYFKVVRAQVKGLPRKLRGLFGDVESAFDHAVAVWDTEEDRW